MQNILFNVKITYVEYQQNYLIFGKIKNGVSFVIYKCNETTKDEMCNWINVQVQSSRKAIYFQLIVSIW